MIIIIILVLLFLLFFLIRRLMKNKIDTITAFTGPLGSGKTALAVHLSLKLYKKMLRKWRWENFKNKIKGKPLLDKPLLLSNIPIKIKRGLYSTKLTIFHLLLRERIPQYSVVFIDEVGSWASQFEFKQPNIVDNFNEFVRLFRHYTLNGYMVVTDQCSENINLWIRRRLNVVTNMNKFIVIPLLHIVLYFSRQVYISEEIKQISEDEDSVYDTYKLNVRWFPLFFRRKHYDTHCFRNRYLTVPKGDFIEYDKLTTNTLLTCPWERIKKLTTDEEGGA